MVRQFWVKNGLLLVITFFVIIVLLSGNIALAEKMKISAQEAEKIKTALNIVQTFTNISNIILNDNDLATVLNKAIGAGRTGTDVTYGLLVLSALNEMELMDLVLSQNYKTEAREYFEQVIEEKTNLLSYWKGVGFDIPKVASGYITGPIGGLTLNTFSITGKIIEIFALFENIKKVKKYDGLWHYFNLRKYDNESHGVAWGEAKEVMGFAAKKTNFLGTGQNREDNNIQLEQQFAALWENWGPYATPWGIDKKYKEQLASELRNTLAAAIEENTDAQPLYAKEPSLWDKFLVQLANIKNTVANLVSQINPFKAGPIVDLPDEKMSEVGLPSIEQPELIEVEPSSVELETQSIIEEPIEEVGEAKPPSTPSIDSQLEEAGEMLPPALAPEPEPAPAPAPTPVPEPTPEPVLCERKSGNPARFRALINEVAWMGTANSANDEWIELKNIWGIPANLSGWQLLDKDRQIKIIFTENNIIPTNGLYLLERTDDDSAPNVSADLIYTGALNNTDEALYLFNADCQLEDEVVANLDWPAGNNTEKKTMERFDGVNWYTGITGGTPKAENSSPPADSAMIVPPPPTSSSSSSPPPVPAPEPESGAGGEQPLLTVVINEIAWMGTKANPADEWIELYNNTALAIDLTGWTLKAADGTPSITFSTSTISAQSYFLLERTDDNTVSDMPADLIYTGALVNTGEKLELRDAGNNLIDSVDSSSGWFAGQASPNYVSMERIDANNWASNNQVPWEGWQGKDANGERINGTPKTKNSVSKNPTTLSQGGFLVENDFTLTLLGSPYLVEGSINVAVGAKLVIEPGVTIKFKHSNYWKSELKVEGELRATNVVFTSFYDATGTQPAAGDWEWLHFKNAQATLDNVVIKYAGKKEGNPPFSPPFTRGAVYIEGGNVQIKNSTIEKNQTLGIWLKNSSNSLIDNVALSNIQGDWEKPAAIFIENSSPIIKNSTFQNNNVGIWIESSASSTVENNSFENNQTPIKTNTLLANFSGNTAQNNNLNGILVSGLGFSETINQIDWQKDNLSYILESSATIASGKTLNIQPGVIVKLKSGGRIYVDGTLKAQGSESEKIVFTSLSQETAGSWHFISFSASSVNSSLAHAVIRYGGWYNVFQGGTGAKSGAVKANSTALSIENSLFESNLYAGLELLNSTTTLANAVFNKNEHGIYVGSGDCPNLAGVSFGEGDNANTIDVWPSSCVE